MVYLLQRIYRKYIASLILREQKVGLPTMSKF